MSESPDRVSPLAAIAAPAVALETAVVFTVRTALTMIDVRGGKEAPLHASARAALGTDLPIAPNTSAAMAGGVILWLGPDQWLLVGEGSPSWSMPLASGVTHTDVSHGRVVVRVTGARALDILSKGCMLDLHPKTFRARMCMQTTIAKIPVIVHRIGRGNEYDLYAPRSYARSLWRWLSRSAEEYGYHVGPVP